MPQTCIHADLAGRRRKFELRLGEIGELERLCNAGIGAIYMRLVSMQWRNDDIRETIRLGLMGGGASEPDATMVVMRYIDPEPKGRHLALAASILSACIEGAPEGNAEGEGPKSDASETSPPSTKSAAPSA
ncbi:MULTISPECIES: gene transfer agent family protein [Methylosinus]|uniref:Gene transfer agent family protein n=1 Tax=Methylosinus trichosporium (strain ATCC 35070 / NCIMB 11131 / UNIQEM 75 / OB3b) TaxID=595536 RepID=A0A2D2CYB4_METT3|nr:MULTISPECIES: gene transfer agent family protein [Methylosinus]ATQ67733.1 gene transfer agent family protein [Methylosinus trichosporium OB3b]OBS51159.1 hypothetical protein A8B73_17725 [Methylosinus sp. 3S-1]